MSLATAYIGIGSNLGDRLGQMQHALNLLEEDGKVRVQSLSPVYKNRAIGILNADDFYNAAAELVTELSPEGLLERCLYVEAELGRIRRAGCSSRTIDLDVLLYDDLSIDTDNLRLPHPRIVQRDFVAIPLLDLNPDIYVLGKPIQDIVNALDVVDLTRLGCVLR